MDRLELLKVMLINSSISASALRNQGAGIGEPIRQKLTKRIDFDEFFEVLKSDNSKLFGNYLSRLTNGLRRIKTIKKNKKVAWGTARKCVNLLLRAIVYNGYIWQKYKLKKSDFTSNGIMNKLELPLDSHVVKGIKKDCIKYEMNFDKAKYSSFSIINLNKTNKKESQYYQKKALKIAKERNVCRVDLDLCYWRNQDNCD